MNSRCCWDSYINFFPCNQYHWASILGQTFLCNIKAGHNFNTVHNSHMYQPGKNSYLLQNTVNAVTNYWISGSWIYVDITSLFFCCLPKKTVYQAFNRFFIRCVQQIFRFLNCQYIFKRFLWIQLINCFFSCCRRFIIRPINQIQHCLLVWKYWLNMTLEMSGQIIQRLWKGRIFNGNFQCVSLFFQRKEYIFFGITNWNELSEFPHHRKIVKIFPVLQFVIWSQCLLKYCFADNFMFEKYFFQSVCVFSVSEHLFMQGLQGAWRGAVAFH